MAPLARTTQQRAKVAIVRMNTAKTPLPAVLTSHDAIGLLGRCWFHQLLRLHRLPGVQVVPQGVWRCDRETFVNWLTEMSYDNPTTMGVAL